MARNQASKRQSQNEGTKRKEPQAPRQEARGGRGGRRAAYAAIAFIAAAAVVAALAYYSYEGSPSNSTASVPFPVFKNNLDSASRIAVVLEFSNNTQLYYELGCSTAVLQVISGERSPTSIDFFEINQTACDYSSRLGYPINLTTPSVSECLSRAQSEPGIFMNYSATFSNTITAQHMYIQGNATYFKSCPLAVDLR